MITIYTPYKTIKNTEEVIIYIPYSSCIVFPDGIIIPNRIKIDIDTYSHIVIHQYDIKTSNIELVLQRLNYEMVRFNIETKQFEIHIHINSYGKEVIVQTELIFPEVPVEPETDITIDQLVRCALVLSESKKEDYDYYFKLLTNTIIQ